MPRGQLERVFAGRGAHPHGRDVDGDDVVAVGIDVVHQLLDHLPGQHHQQQAVVHGVRVEDLPEARRDDRLHAELLEPPHRVLAAGAAAEVGAAHQDAGAGVGGPVQHEIGARLAGGVEAVVVEHALGQPGLVDPAQELLGDDLVGVEVLEADGRALAGNGCLIRHGRPPACGHR
ncbi:hypothetical protein D3C72_1640870 [compost metagenome]